MIFFSNTVMYATRAIMDIVAHQDLEKNKPVRLQDTADRQKIPFSFLGKIAHALNKAKLTKVLRGPNGGQLIIVDKITMYDIMAALDSLPDFVRDAAVCSRNNDFDSIMLHMYKMQKMINTQLRTAVVYDKKEDKRKFREFKGNFKQKEIKDKLLSESKRTQAAKISESTRERIERNSTRFRPHRKIVVDGESVDKFSKKR